MTAPKRKRPKKITATKPDFPRPMGVPCVDLNLTAGQTITYSDIALAVEEAKVVERRTPTPTLRYYAAKGLLAIARTLRQLAYRIAS